MRGHAHRVLREPRRISEIKKQKNDLSASDFNSVWDTIGFYPRIFAERLEKNIEQNLPVETRRLRIKA